MNLLVTGGAGFIGSHFVRAVLADRLPGLEGASVTVLDKMTYAANYSNLGPVAEDERLDFVPADVTDDPVVNAAVRGHDVVVHFAAESSPVAGTDFATPVVVGTQVMLEAARRHGVARFALVSAAEVYGPIETGAWTERSHLAPGSPRAAAKAGADLIALAYHHTHGVPVVVTRSSPTYGPYQHPERTVPRLVTALLAGRTVPLAGEGARVREWLHVEDHCRGVALALLRGRPGEIYHIAGSIELSDRDLLTQILTECEAGWDRVVAAPDDRTAGRRLALDDDKIRRELGWRPRMEFAAGLRGAVNWYRANESWWRPLLPE